MAASENWGSFSVGVLGIRALLSRANIEVPAFRKLRNKEARKWPRRLGREQLSPSGLASGI